MITLEQIEELIQRTGADYPTVRDALLEAEGDMYKAMQIIEAKQAAYGSEEEKEPTADDILQTLRDVLSKVNATSIIVRKEDKTVLNLSATVGAIGVILAPIAALIGLGAAAVTDYDIIIELEDGRDLNLNAMAKDHINDAKAGWETYTTRRQERRADHRTDETDDSTAEAPHREPEDYRVVPQPTQIDWEDI